MPYGRLNPSGRQNPRPVRPSSGEACSYHIILKIAYRKVIKSLDPRPMLKVAGGKSFQPLIGFDLLDSIIVPVSKPKASQAPSLGRRGYSPVPAGSVWPATERSPGRTHRPWSTYPPGTSTVPRAGFPPPA